jgi:hypothetical protein
VDFQKLTMLAASFRTICSHERVKITVITK